MQVARRSISTASTPVPGDVLRQRSLQAILESVMEQLMAMAAAQGLPVFLPACRPEFGP